MKSIYTLGLFFILSVTGLMPGYSQIMGVGHQSMQLTNYSSGKQDSVFAFCTSDPSGGELIATSKKPDNHQFVWFKYDNINNEFDTIAIQPYVAGSTLSNCIEGGYRVSIDTFEIYTVWVFLNDLEIDSVIVDSSSCDYLNLEGLVVPNEFTYYDYNNGGASKKLNNALIVNWTSNPSGSSGIYLNFWPVVPPENTDYTLLVTDNFGCSDNQTVSINKKAPGTEFSYTTDKDDDLPKDAPLEVSFTNESVNAGSFQWFVYFYLDNYHSKDTLVATSTDANPVIIFERPGHYRATLLATSPEGCPEEYTLDSIPVDSVKIVIPNVFSPGGNNPVFRIKDVSVKSIHVTIFTRWGLKVHEYEGEMDNWEGWNGKIKNSDKDALPGIYYYVMQFYGWDELDYKGKQYTGFVYLFRGK